MNDKILVSIFPIEYVKYFLLMDKSLTSIFVIFNVYYILDGGSYLFFNFNFKVEKYLISIYTNVKLFNGNFNHF